MDQTSLMSKLQNGLKTWLETARQRRALRTGGQALAKDIGISYATLTHEAQRSCWDTDSQKKDQKPIVSIRSKRLQKLRIIN